MSPTFEVYEDDAGEWRWRLRYPNGEIVADSGEGYGSRSAAHDAVGRVQGGVDDADIDGEELRSSDDDGEEPRSSDDGGA